MKLLIFAKRHLPTIITVVSCAGVAATGYLSAKGAVKAQKKLETEDFKRNFDAGEEEHEAIPTIDKVKIVYKDYMPAIIVGGVTMGSIIFANAYHIKTEKNLLAACAMSTTLLNRYEQQIIDRTDPEMAAEIRGEVIGGLCDDIHESYSDPESRMLCYEPCSKTWFRASQTEFLLAEIELNKCLMNGGGMRLGDFLHMFTDDICDRYQDPFTIGWIIDDTYAWNSGFFGYHCGILCDVEEVDGVLCNVVRFSHDPFTPEDGFLL